MAVFVVTTLADEALDSNVPFDLSREAADGIGLSLREALGLANGLAGADEIIFAPELANGRLTLTREQLQITSDVTINGDAAGDGTSHVILDGDYQSRVFDVASGISSISSVDITRGGRRTENEPPGVGDGGGITVADGAELTITETRIYRNEAGGSFGTLGGGIYNAGILTVSASEIFDNGAGISRSSSDGGGIANVGTLTITDTLISGNSTAGRIPGGGGGIYNSGTTLATNVVFTGNFGLHGSAINNTGTMWASGATITGNRPDNTIFGQPNAIRNEGQLTFVQSTITGNSGMEIDNRAEVTLVNSIVTQGPGWIVKKLGHNIVGTAIFDGDTQIGNVRAVEVFADFGPDGPVLQDNGGSLPTLMLRASDLNPALDAGDGALAVDASGAPLEFDGRGAVFARHVDLPYVGPTGAGPVDLGALELTFDAVDTFEFNTEVLPVLSYGGRQDRGTFEMLGVDARLAQQGNAWNHIMADYEVTADTVLTFRLATLGQAEIWGIGFDNDDRPESETYFQLGGTQQGFGIQDFKDESQNSQSAQDFRIPVGEYFTGQFDRLVFVNDQDAPPSLLQDQPASIWSDVMLFEDVPRLRLNGQLEPVQSYGSRQDSGSVEIFGGGTVAVQDANSWKQIAIDYEVTENTLLEFDFDTFNKGELHAIGFSNHDRPDGNTFFTLLGTQDGFGIRDFFGTTEVDDGPRSYSIPVGQYFTGQFSHLVLATDDDANNSADSIWFDLWLTEGL